MQTISVVKRRLHLAVPTTPNENGYPHLRSQLPQSDEMARWRDEEVDMFKMALDGKITDKDAALIEYLQLRSQTEESVESLIHATKDLQLVR